MASGAGRHSGGERAQPAITLAASSEFIALIGRLPIVVDETIPSLTLRTVLDLVRSEGLSAYDVSHLELAMRPGVPLATKDDALAQAARRVGLSLPPTA